MNLFSILALLGGLAFFLYGMHIMSTGLGKLAGGKLERTLKLMTSHPWKSLLLGTGVTAVIQSSSAVTVMLVGLVNSGIMTLPQTVEVIMGSNIGTTVTAWLVSMVGIESSNVFIKLLKPENFSPVIALIGVFLIMASKRQRRRDIGTIMAGFAVLMYGMKMMASALSPLSELPAFTNLMTAFNNPLLGVLVGFLITGIIQSSSASVGILQALSLTGSITYGMALPIIMGQNIGTCVTAIISSFGVNNNAKRVAAVHVSFNVIGTLLFLSVFFGLHSILHFAFMEDTIGVVGIALFHSAFNIITSIVLLPFSKKLVKLANVLVREKKTAQEYVFLDDRLLNTPAVAVAECNNQTVQMAKISRDTILSSLRLLENFSESRADEVLENEHKLDVYEDKLGTFLVKLAGKALTDKDSREVSKMLHCIGNFERIGDHAVNLLESAREMHDKQISFSPMATADLEVLVSAVTEILNYAVEAYEKDDINIASFVEPLEQVIDRISEMARMRHIERLRGGACTIELGFILADLLANIERVSDHCSNVAVCIIELSHNGFSTHAYLNDVKSGSDEAFVERFNSFADRFTLEDQIPVRELPFI